MEADIPILVQSIGPVVAGYLSAVAGKVTEAVADGVVAQGKALISWLGQKLTRAGSREALAEAQADPSSDNCTELLHQVQRELERNAELAAELQALVRKLHLSPAGQGDLSSVQTGSGHKSVQIGPGSTGNRVTIH